MKRIPLYLLVTLSFNVLTTSAISAFANAPLYVRPNAFAGMVKGDGISDDTKALQAMIAQADRREIIFDGGEYLINATLELKSGCKVTGLNGAVLKAGPDMKGTLQKYGRFFFLNNVSDCRISGLKFISEGSPFKLNGWGDACISIYNSTNSVIENNIFDFNQGYHIQGVEAVWVSGAASRNTVIRNNDLKGLGIKYAENGAGYTLVENNRIIDAHANALTANGNSETFIVGCKLINNLIENAGRMGIEDWGKVDGTLIEGNTVNGTGKDPEQAHEGLGISTVGINTRVLKNKIYDAKIFYLELGGNHNIIAEDNEIYDLSGKATGVILNFTSKMPAPLEKSLSVVSGSIIDNCNKAIEIFGSNSPVCSITNNVIKNQKSHGICIDSDSPFFNIELIGNQIFIEFPTNIVRRSIDTYTNLPSGSTNHNLLVQKNRILYAPAVNGGSGFDQALLILADGAKVIENEIIGNNVKSGGYPVYAISGNGGTAMNLTFTRNKVSGALVDLKGYKNMTLESNEFSETKNL